MEYIIFGAGDDGQQALYFLGENRVKAFCDTQKAGMAIASKDVISFGDMVAYYQKKEIIIVIASTKYQVEMEYLLKQHGINRYFVYNNQASELMMKYLPWYIVYGKSQFMSYTEIFMNYEVYKYRHIAVCGITPMLPYVIAEICFQCGKITVDYIIDDEVTTKQEYMGIPIVHSQDVWDKIDCLVVCAERKDTNIRDIIPIYCKIKVVDVFYIDDFIPIYQHPELSKFKDCHKGKRCFIIGNGPSLRVDDLDVLHRHKEVCFGVNSIYQLFSKTAWRPNYLCISDLVLAICLHEEVKSLCIELFLSDSYHTLLVPKYDNVNYVHVKGERTGNNLPGFSEDITKVCYAGGVIYSLCLQIAAYMGFSDIYLLGVDLTSFNIYSAVKSTVFRRYHF